MFMPAPASSLTMRVVAGPSANSGASFMLVTVMVTSIVSEAPDVSVAVTVTL